jgi:hypothetical protein
VSKAHYHIAIIERKDRYHVQKEYEVCVHTCVSGGCVNLTTKTILWWNEGHACRRHVCITKAYPLCGQDDNDTAGCPGYRFLRQSGHAKDGTREPAKYE